MAVLCIVSRFVCHNLYRSKKRGSGCPSTSIFPVSPDLQLAVAYAKYLFKSIYPADLAVVYTKSTPFRDNSLMGNQAATQWYRNVA